MIDYYLRSVLPASTHNDELVLDRDTWSIIVRNSVEFAGQSYQHPLVAHLPKKLPPATPMTCLQNSFVYVITESMCEHTPVYFTDKTWKAMTSLAPFMLIGSRHSLSKLRDFGFKTFDGCGFVTDNESRRELSYILPVVNNLLVVNNDVIHE